MAQTATDINKALFLPDDCQLTALLIVTHHGERVLTITPEKEIIPGDGLSLEEAMDRFAETLAENYRTTHVSGVAA